MDFRQKQEEFEAEMLSPGAAQASQSCGRPQPEPECEMRTCFQRDVDRIVHSKAFRRLKHKTQVFLQPEGDHYRTRLTHTIEVMRISRTIARALRLNEDLTEAIAWGHDLGHTPFGHAGERALADICPLGFAHNEQSLRVVDRLEKNGRGLNLCHETRDGIRNHSGGDPRPMTLEGEIVHLSDRIAYINHDLDDAIRAGILKHEDIPAELIAATSENYSERLNAFISDILNSSRDCSEIRMSPEMYFVMESFRDFMFSKVYLNPLAKGEEAKVLGILDKLFNYFLHNPEKLPEDCLAACRDEPLSRAVCDYIAGMTDQYALHMYNELFIPVAWRVL